MQTASPLIYEYVDNEYLQRDPGGKAREFITGTLLLLLLICRELE